MRQALRAPSGTWQRAARLTKRAACALGLVSCAACGNSSPRVPTSGDASTRPAASAASAGTLATSRAEDTSAAALASARPRARGAIGVWEEVTSPAMPAELFSGDGAFGVGNIVTDPARPTDLYVGGYGSLWKSTDYGSTWKQVASKPDPPDTPLGRVLAVAGTTPATLWIASPVGEEHVYRSTDGGLSFELTGRIAGAPGAASLYSIAVDPSNPRHLVSGLHEADKIVESNDAGDTWRFVSGRGFPTGGKSWFPFFIDTGDSATTARTWFAIAQDGGSPVITEDGGATWKKPKGIENLEHPHGGAALFQHGKTLFVAGIYGPGTGIYRSTDLGQRWSKVSDGSGAIVWGSSKNVYAMWGWACSQCTDGPDFRSAPQPGDAGTWRESSVPRKLNWGPNSVATTSDGTHTIFVGSMWTTGLWRYIEP